MKNHIFVANWKQNKDYLDSLQWLENNKTELHALVEQATIIICPNFVALARLCEISKGMGLFLGAQNCSAEARGNFTGEVSAKTLKEAGASSCIVGHSERRRLFGETHEQIAKKTQLLLENGITPILCVGETQKDMPVGEITGFLANQLNSSTTFSEIEKIYIAYEPGWAIGTNQVPETGKLREIMAWLQGWVKENLGGQGKVLYGGSVSPENIGKLKTLPEIDGFLVGNGSLDFQNFKKIVLSK